MSMMGAKSAKDTEQQVTDTLRAQPVSPTSTI